MSLRNKLKGTSKLSKEPIPEPKNIGVAIEEKEVTPVYCLMIDIDTIKANPNQPRKHFNEEALTELAESIKQKGILQPILVRQGADDEIILVAGERRTRAAKLAGLKKIPAMLTSGNHIEISLIENLQRENLTSIEEAEALSLMLSEYGYTHERLAYTVGKKRSTITEILTIAKLPAEIKDHCRSSDNMPKHVLIELAKQKSETDTIELFEKIKSGKVKGNNIRALTRGNKQTKENNPHNILLEKISALKRLIEKIDAGQLSGHKVKLTHETKGLIDQLNHFLSTLNGAN